MFNRQLVVAGVAGALGLIVAASAAPVLAAPVSNKAIEIVGAGAAADPLIAVEANRSAIVDRIVADHADVIATMGNGAEAALRTALAGLRADQLLAASLVGSLGEVTAIISGPAGDGAALQRFVALAPTAATATLPSAQAYLVRNADTLTITAAADLAASGGQVVGYFTAAGTMTAAGVIAPKDGSGTGAGSWIGYTAGGNVASGSGSAVAAGKFNAATATNASIFAGQSNEAGGLSSLVIGGFDNHALGIDTLVGAGAGNRAVGTRSVVVGGGYNLATGNWSFIGGGGRDGTAATTAGSDPKDNIASGNFSVVTGGQGNRATGTQSVVSGGANNLASGLQSAIPGGLGNTASNNGTVAMGRNATAASFGSFVFSDGTVYSDNGNYTFNVQALGGMYLSPSTDLDFGSQTRQMIRLWGGPDKYGIGVQGSTQYFRVDTGGGNGSGFAWYQGGTHSDTAFDPGTGGVRLMTLSRDGQLALPTTTQQAITLSSSAKGIGGQSFTTYVRVPSTGGMGIYESGTHNNNEADAGGGGILAGIFRTGSGSLFQTATVTGTLRVVNVVATSDRESKTSFAAVAPKEILAKVASMPITTWVYKNEGVNAPRHIGPVAQDFAAFGVGQDDKTISTVDASGVALAAIKGLHEELQERDAKIAAQASQIKALERTVSELVATQEDVKVMKAALAELLRERAELGMPVRLTGSGATLIAH